MKTEEVNREEMENVSGGDNSYRKILLDAMEKEKKKGRVDGFLAKSAPHRSQRAAFLHWAPYKANTSHQFSYILT